MQHAVERGDDVCGLASARNNCPSEPRPLRTTALLPLAFAQLGFSPLISPQALFALSQNSSVLCLPCLCPHRRRRPCRLPINLRNTSLGPIEPELERTQLCYTRYKAYGHHTKHTYSRGSKRYARVKVLLQAMASCHLARRD